MVFDHLYCALHRRYLLRINKFIFLIVIGALTVFETAHGDERQSPIWIDVRTPAEYETGHLPGALNINFDVMASKISDITSNKDSEIYLYCKSGRRSGFAKQTLEKLGYKNVTNAGGLKRVLRAHGVAPETGT